VPNRLAPQNLLRLAGFMVNWSSKVEPYINEQIAAFDLRTRQTHHKPLFPIPVNTRTVCYPSKLHALWLAIPEALKPSVEEPPKHIAVESDFEQPSRAKHPDIPDNMAFDAMGTSERVNEHMDSRILDDRLFRETCVQIGTGMDRKNLFLEPKHGMSRHAVYPLERIQPEIGPPSPFAPYKTTVRGRFTRAQTFLTPDWIVARLGCSFELACELKDAFEKLQISSWELASRIIYGKVGSGKINLPFKTVETKLKGIRLYGGDGSQLCRTHVAEAWENPHGVIVGENITRIELVPQCAKGLISYVLPIGPPDMRGLEAAIHYISEMAREVDEVTVEWPQMSNLDLPEDHPDLDVDEFWANADLGPDELPFIEDDLDVYGGDANPFTGHTLFGDGSEALPLVFCDAIREADDFRLSAAARMMRPYVTEITPPVWKVRDDICIIDEQTDKVLGQIVSGTRRPKKLDPIKKYLVLVTPGVYRKPNCGLNADQTAHFWGLWHDQRAAISSGVENTTDFKRYARNLSLIAARGRAASYLFALKNGTEWRIGRDIIHHKGVVVIPTALKKLWAIFNERFPKDEAPVAAGMDIPW